MNALETTPPEKTTKDSPVRPEENIKKAASPRTSGGLSELSKQLRVLQAKNQAQSVEIDRLERQLRILADLQGISVADLRNALQQACEAEAFGELQHRVASLRAQLEAASLAKVSIASAAQDAANAKKIANLELRVGELEEVEEKQRAEIQKLYSQLMEQQANGTRLEALVAQLRSENEQLELHQQEGTPRESGEVRLADTTSQDEALAARARDAEMEAQILREKLKLSEQQREAAEQQSKLRNAQFKARFILQSENIQDLEQQLSSLYVAFEILREEKAKDDDARLALQDNLGHADAEVARQVSHLERSNRSPRSETIPQSPTKTVEGKPIEPVLSSTLLIKSSSGMIKKWKKRHVLLFSTLTHHHLDIGEERGYALQFGISTLEPYPKMPFGFIIHIGRNRESICAAATNEDDYHRWMAALMFATTGAEYNAGSDHNDTSEGSEQRPVLTRVPSAAEREATDLGQVLEMSQHDVV
jgi:DNA repair exonuclease SbcCD ATPase subunit